MMEIINTIKHLIADRDKEPLGKKRSSKWPAVRKKHLEENPNCVSCGSTLFCEVHHIVPFHVDPSRELDPSNLVTLCESKKWLNCHLFLGHRSNYRDNNPNVIEDAAYMSGILANRQNFKKTKEEKVIEINNPPEVIYEVNTNAIN